MDTPTLRESVSDAMRFWEPRRLIYNALLSVIVLFYFFKAYPASKAVLRSIRSLGCFSWWRWRISRIVPPISQMCSLSGPRIVISGGDSVGSCLPWACCSRELSPASSPLEFSGLTPADPPTRADSSARTTR